ncbi:MAG TPA: BMC domain-containing protein [Phycisphaerae bacterium]|nr:BMC domain-containing protein [Phycisphaerae bacterium]HOM51269.1 BMC domain-containing protein [Phycisphaerae bacterium]
MREAIGMIETTSIGIGFAVQDAMLKAANVQLVLGRTICSGKYINVVTGSVADARAAVDAGLAAAPDGVIDHILIPNVHPNVFAALGQSVQLRPGEDRFDAVGIVETYSAASVLAGADAAAKAAGVTLYRIHVAMAIGGKGFMLMTGSVSDCRTGVNAAAEVVREKGLLVSAVVIPGPSKELYSEYI